MITLPLCSYSFGLPPAKAFMQINKNDHSTKNYYYIFLLHFHFYGFFLTTIYITVMSLKMFYFKKLYNFNKLQLLEREYLKYVQ